MKRTTSITYPAFALFALACFALAPQVRATCQQGCLIRSNTVLGDDALLNNTTGFNNTAIGLEALFNNTDGFQNTAIGFEALFGNIDGTFNTATGFDALFGNTIGSANTATGADALSINTAGGFNTATGYQALVISTGDSNTGTGALALNGNSTGNDNTAEGYQALFKNTTGTDNIAVGSSAGFNLTTGSNNIDIGNKGSAGESNTIRVGTSGTQTKTIIAGIFGTTVAGGVGVIVGSGGRLGTVVSSARFKEEVKPMDNASEAILALKPVTFRYKKDLDPDGIPQFGLVAEDVEKVNPDLVARDNDGKPYSVRYEAVNAMLLNEFLKEHKASVNEREKVEKLEATVAGLVATVKEQAAQIQKVSARLEAGKPAPQVVNNP